MHQQVHLQWWRESVSKNDSLGRRPGKGGGGNGGPAEEPLAELAMAAELVPYIDEKETLSKATCRFMAKRLLQVFTALSLCFHCPFSVLSPHFTVFSLSFHCPFTAVPLSFTVVLLLQGSSISMAHEQVMSWNDAS